MNQDPNYFSLSANRFFVSFVSRLSAKTPKNFNSDLVVISLSSICCIKFISLSLFEITEAYPIKFSTLIRKVLSISLSLDKGCSQLRIYRTAYFPLVPQFISKPRSEGLCFKNVILKKASLMFLHDSMVMKSALKSNWMKNV